MLLSLPVSELDITTPPLLPPRLSIPAVSVSSAGARYSSRTKTDASTPIRPQRTATSLVHTVPRRRGKRSHGLQAAPRRPCARLHTLVHEHILQHSCLITGSLNASHRPLTKVLREIREAEVLAGHAPLWWKHSADSVQDVNSSGRT